MGSKREGSNHRIQLERENRWGWGEPDEASTWPPGALSSLLEQRDASRMVPVLEVPSAPPQSQQPRTVQTAASTTHTCVPGWQVGGFPGEGGRSGVLEGRRGETCRNVGGDGEAAGALEEAHPTCRVQSTPQRGNSVKTRLKFALHSLLPEGPQEIRGSYVHIRELKCLASLALI